MKPGERCPRCGAANQCAQAGREQPVEQCWCFTAAIDPALLPPLPQDPLEQACLCPRCAQDLALPAADVPD